MCIEKMIFIFKRIIHYFLRKWKPLMYENVYEKRFKL